MSLRRVYSVFGGSVQHEDGVGESFLVPRDWICFNSVLLL